MRAILVDDEAMALEVLSTLLENYDDIEIVGKYTDPTLALEEIQDVKADVIFLDIEMGPINGLEIAELFMNKRSAAEIIFITAYSKYAVEAFEINALDYLLKPIQENRLSKTIKRLREISKDASVERGKDKSLHIHSFGHFQVMDNQNNPLSWRTRKSKELFAYLWLQGDKPIAKSLILENIFADRDMDKATTLLHTTIYQLRKNLRELGNKDGILYTNDSYQLNVTIKSDLDRFRNIISSEEWDEEDILNIFKLYQGHFLEEEGYYWAMGEQQIYENMFFKYIADYARKKLKSKNYSSILKLCLNKMYELDPFNEEVAEMIIEFYGNQGETSQLESFFNRYTKNLQKELDIPPVESTIELYSRYMG